MKSSESTRIYQDNGVFLKGYQSILGYQKYVDEDSILLTVNFT